MHSGLNFINLCIKDRLERERVTKEAKKMIMSPSRGYDPKDLNYLIIFEIAARKNL